MLGAAGVRFHARAFGIPLHEAAFCTGCRVTFARPGAAGSRQRRRFVQDEPVPFDLLDGGRDLLEIDRLADVRVLSKTLR
jgi:hypothetical protein